MIGISRCILHFRAATPGALVRRGHVQRNARRAEGGRNRGPGHQRQPHPDPWQETNHDVEIVSGKDVSYRIYVVSM